MLLPCQVAEALSNIAIIYNQRDNYEKARPLFERALAIFEAAEGPESQNVAHTLTDLAVLHLEQVCAHNIPKALVKEDKTTITWPCGANIVYRTCSPACGAAILLFDKGRE